MSRVRQEQENKENNCLYKSTFPRNYTAVVFVAASKTEQHSHTKLSSQSSCTASMFGWGDLATFKILAGIHGGGVRCNKSSRVICTIHSIQALAPPHPLEFGCYSFLVVALTYPLCSMLPQVQCTSTLTQ